MSDTDLPDQDRLIEQLLTKCREDRRVNDSTACAARALLKDYRRQEGANNKPGRPRKLRERDRLVEYDALTRVYAFDYADPRSADSVRSAADYLKSNRRTIARWRADPEFQKLVDQAMQDEWDWVNSEEFEPD